MLKLSAYIILFLILAGTQGLTQVSNQQQIDAAIASNDIGKATLIFQKISGIFEKGGQADSLAEYVFYAGKITQQKSGNTAAIVAVNKYLDRIKAISPTSNGYRQALVNAGEFYGSAGLNAEGYHANEQAYAIALQQGNPSPTTLAVMQGNMGTYAQRMGDINRSQAHHRLAMKLLESDPKPNFERLYITYNSMGGIMWYASKHDSSRYYFNKALKALEKADSTPINKYYRPATLQNNLAALFSINGQSTKAIEAMRFTIENLRLYVNADIPEAKRSQAIAFQFEATDNLAGIYKELGDNRQAKNLLEYSYNQKQKYLEPDNPGIAISQVLLGQLYYQMRDYDKAKEFLVAGRAALEKLDGDYLFWMGDACYSLALLNDMEKNYAAADTWYDKADSLYELSFQGDYDINYLEYLDNASLFYAEQNNTAKALAKAGKGYRYILQTQGYNSLSLFYQLLNLTQVHYQLKNYKQALIYSEKALAVVNSVIAGSDNLLDSVKAELKKPKAILLHVKAAYQLLPKRDIESLNSLVAQLDKGVDIIERRKNILTDPADIGLVVADHNDLLEFLKQLNFDLYQLTGDQAYADRVMNLQESALYNRIRSRLDKNDSLSFASVPPSIINKERALKAEISQTLMPDDASHNEKIQRYLRAVADWEKFHSELKRQYPRYYNMRYGSLFATANEYRQALPGDATVLRYFFIAKELYVMVADRQQMKMIKLQPEALKEAVATVSAGADLKTTATNLNNLYRQLWQPIEKLVRHTKVIVIPDGVLYSLNFDLLTPKLIHSYTELATESLVAKYSFSYQYSMLLLDHKPGNFKNDFVAFAPGFTDDVKNDYSKKFSDPVSMDRSYMTLLPQPFTIDLATHMRDLLGGGLFLKQQSTVKTFRNFAGNHKIIHIGTHAESNNDHPEFSRLFFAKEGNSENSLYVNDIYDCDLAANLAVLTACESGKPGYQDGEGMISLAHAFNFAGSESILTGLWKIDEQASVRIMEFFYQGLLDGLPKDEALRQAKLAYLASADGRMLEPKYWGGLVIMGDTSTVAIKPAKNILPWLLLFDLLLMIAVFFYNRQLRLQISRQ